MLPSGVVTVGRVSMAPVTVETVGAAAPPVVRPSRPRFCAVANVELSSLPSACGSSAATGRPPTSRR